jgi:glycosyltransferase involved in cell wall biosynthesis
MKLLVLAQIPPPLHGQSMMVRTLVEGLPAQGIPVHHVNLSLSRSAADIGRWRLGKVAALIDACLHTVATRLRHGCDTLYYVPAPGKRSALYRDWLVMLLCRPFFKRLVLHWHGAGLGEWLRVRATAPERKLTHFLLGGADLSIVLSPSLGADAEALGAKSVAVVANGIDDPCPDFTGRRRADRECSVLFVGLCSEEKGLFAAAEAVLAANRLTSDSKSRFTLTAAGPFPDPKTARRFHDLCTRHPELRYAGPVHDAEKRALFQASHLFCLPTRYGPEGQPLVLLDAIAYDLPIVATRWRGIPCMLPPQAVLIEPGDAVALTNALIRLQGIPPDDGHFRQHFLAQFTSARHLQALVSALHAFQLGIAVSPPGGQRFDHREFSQVVR